MKNAAPAKPPMKLTTPFIRGYILASAIYSPTPESGLKLAIALFAASAGCALASNAWDNRKALRNRPTEGH